MPKLLLIDDDERLAELLGRYVERYEMELEAVTRPSAGFERLAQGGIDAVILDVMLPEMDGFEVCKTIRRDSEVPIIMLTARGEVMDRVVGLELGADDYLPKPFEPRELVARIQTILKRSSRSAAPTHRLQFDTLIIDTDRREASLDGQVLNLTGMEYQLLELLAMHPGKVYTRDEILNGLKGIDVDLYTRSVDILISRLRAKLKPLGMIKTVRGSGYCFVGAAHG